MAAKKKAVTSNKLSSNLVTNRDEIYVVGIGASSGGLDALRPLIAKLKGQRKATYIIAQHHSPKHPSLLTELLREQAKIPIDFAADGSELLPDHVYVIPPHQNLLIIDGRIRLMEPETNSLPSPSVDVLFKSIAENYMNRSVGVVLSGTGSDGSLGAEAIKSVGGVVIAQVQEEAEQKEMPFSVVKTGFVDMQLPVREIAAYLNSLGDPRKAETKPIVSKKVKVFAEAPAFRQLIDMVFKATQMDVSLYKEPTLIRQIEKRFNSLGLKSIEDYIDFVLSHSDELHILQHSFLISVTSFFRDPEPFLALDRVMRGIIANKKPGDSIRVWVPGCATGEEAYTIAIMLKEAIGNRLADFDVRVFATDIDIDAMTFARDGVYPPSALEKVNPAWREHYFTREGNSYKISKTIRELCVFSIHDVVRHPPFMRMDIVSCRNLLIYFKPALQEQLFASFYYALNPDGYLLLGKSESVGPSSKLFETLDGKNKIFRRKSTTVSFPTRTEGRSFFIPFTRMPVQQYQKEPASLLDVTRDVLMSEYAPPSILVSKTFDVLHFFGDAKRYLDFPKGSADFSLFSICVPELRSEMKTLCYRITQEGVFQVAGLPTKVVINGQSIILRLNLRRVHLTKENNGDYGLLISFEQLKKEQVDLQKTKKADKEFSENAVNEIQKLQQELADTREHLQAVIEELEASNEELQSLNEELQSSSEELQSSNEELQSSNEELSTLNDELRTKSGELLVLNTTLSNIQESIHIGLVVVDKDGKVMRFNDLAVRVFGLMQGDIGKPIYNVPCHLELPRLRKQINSVINTGTLIIERAKLADYQYLMQIAPYVNESEQRTGVVLTFTDISDLQRTEDALRQSEETYRSLFRNMLNGFAYCRMIFKDGEPDDFTYLKVNDAFEALTGLKDVEGKNVTELIPGIKETDRKLFEIYGRVATTGQPERFETYVQALQMWFWISVYSPENNYFVAVFEVITERKRAEDALQFTLTKYKTLFDAFPLGITVADGTGQIVESNHMAEKLLGLTPEEQHQREIHGEEWKIVRLDGSPMPAEEYASVRALKEKQIVRDVEMGVMKPSSEISWINVTAAPIPLQNGGVVITYADITERKHAQDELLRSEARLHLAQKAANAGTWEWNLRTNENIWSEEVWPLYGLDPNSSKSSYETWLKTIHPDDREKTQKAVLEAAKLGRELTAEWRVVDSEGKERWIMSRGQPVYDIAGIPERFIGIVMDITERKKAEIAIAEESIRRRILFEQAKDGIVVLDHHSKVVEANSAFAEMLGYTIDEVRQLHVWDWDVNYPSREELLGIWPELPMTSGTIETRHRHKDGSVYDVEITANPADWGGQRQLYCVCRDITERKRAREALQESEEKLRLFIEHAPVSLAMFDRDMRYLYASQRWFSEYGLADQDITGHSHYEIFPEIPDRWKDVHQRGLAGEVITNEQDPFIRLNGLVQWVRWEVRPWYTLTKEVGGIIIFTEDITERLLALEALKESEERYRLLFENMTNGFALHEIICDEQGKPIDYRFLKINPAFEKLTGLSANNLLGKTVRETIPNIEDLWIERYGKVALTGEPITFENYAKPIDRHYHVFSFSPKPNHFAVVFEDITDRKKAEEKLLESEGKLKSILQAAPVGIGLVSNRIILQVNETITTMVGFSEEELIGKSARILYSNDEEFERVGKEKYAQIEKDGFGVIETKWLHKNGKIVDIILSSAPIDPTDFSKGITFSAQDITERKQAVEKLMVSEAKYRLISENTGDVIWMFDLEKNQYTYVSPSVERLRGYTPEEVFTQTMADTLTPESMKLVSETLPSRIQLLESGDEKFRTMTHEVDQPTRDGMIVPTEVVTTLVQNDAGKVVGIIGVTRNITERKKAEAAIKESEERFRLTFRTSPDAINVNRLADARYVDVNEGFTRVSGYTREDVVGKTSLDINIWYDLADREEMVRQLVEKGYCENLETIFRKKDGSLLDGLLSARIIMLQGEEHVITITRDITERKKMEEEIKLSEEKYRLLSENATDIIWTIDFNTERFTYFSPSIQTLRGYTPEEAMAIPLNQTLTHEAYVKAKAELKDAFVKESTPGYQRGIARLLELQEICKDGTIIDTEAKVKFTRDKQGNPTGLIGITRDITQRKRAENELRKLSLAVERNPNVIVITDLSGRIEYVNPVFEVITGYTRQEVIGKNPRILKSGDQSNEFYHNLWKTITDGKTWEGRFINKKKNGSVYTEEATILPLRNSSGQIVNYVAVKRDITEHLQLQADRERLQEQLLQARKMESVGRLAGGVAHDFNNMLHVIIGHTDMILDSAELAKKTHDSMFEVRKAAQRSADLVRQLLTFARKQAVSPKVLDLNTTIGGMLKMLQPLLGEEISLTWLPGEDLWSVKVDPSQIDQLLTNLLVNARDAIKGVGKIRIETKNIGCDEAYCVKRPSVMPGEYAMIIVSDNGCGMDKNTLDHIFEPFFTTKDIGEGTGLGLATVYGIVKQNSGFIHVESKPGKGSTFEIYIPKWGVEVVETAMPEGKTVALPGDGETLLLVEDEDTILDICKTMLEQLGYKVLTASTPTDALKLAEKHAGKIKLLITDVVMPEMNGRELADKIIEMQPGLKCLFMSGYTADIIASRGVLEEGTHFLQKPFYMKDLAAKIRETLG